MQDDGQEGTAIISNKASSQRRKPHKICQQNLLVRRKPLPINFVEVPYSQIEDHSVVQFHKEKKLIKEKADFKEVF